MPELPEVENVRRSLVPHLVGACVIDVRVHRRDVITTANDPAGGYGRNHTKRRARYPRVGGALLLKGARIERVVRHGKQLAIIGDSGASFRVLLGMTGQLLVRSAGAAPLSRGHVHVRWTLGSGDRMLFSDPRRFGGVWTCETPEDLERAWSALGPDALDVRASTLARRLAGTRRGVKAALLDQGVIAGVGNIYADEALFRAQIRPDRMTRDLEPAEVKRLATAIRTILRDAVRLGGSTLRDFADADGRRGRTQDRHRVYGRAGSPCLRCGTALASARVSQRTTTWCERCQV